MAIKNQINSIKASKSTALLKISLNNIVITPSIGQSWAKFHLLKIKEAAVLAGLSVLLQYYSHGHYQKEWQWIFQSNNLWIVVIFMVIWVAMEALMFKVWLTLEIMVSLKHQTIPMLLKIKIVKFMEVASKFHTFILLSDATSFKMLLWVDQLELELMLLIGVDTLQEFSTIVENISTTTFLW